jgi:REP element-mobilizing transposase RayT
MNSFRQSFYHIVFCTYKRENTLLEIHQKELYSYIWGIIQNRKSVLIRINGTENHIHLLCNLHSSISLAEFVKEIKVASHQWINQTEKFPEFKSWAEGYCALSCSNSDKGKIDNYIRGQKEHHKKRDFDNELRALLMEFGVEFDERHLL